MGIAKATCFSVNGNLIGL